MRNVDAMDFSALFVALNDQMGPWSEYGRAGHLDGPHLHLNLLHSEATDLSLRWKVVSNSCQPDATSFWYWRMEIVRQCILAIEHRQVVRDNWHTNKWASKQSAHEMNVLARAITMQTTRWCQVRVEVNANLATLGHMERHYVLAARWAAAVERFIEISWPDDPDVDYPAADDPVVAEAFDAVKTATFAVIDGFTC